MGRNSHRRHADKQRGRTRDERRRPSPDGRIDAAFAARVALAALMGDPMPGAPPGDDAAVFAALPQTVQQAAIEIEFDEIVPALFAGGWTPLDLFELARRTVTGPAVDYLLAVAARCTAELSAARVDPRWLAQLHQLGARPVPSLREWIARTRRPWSELVGPLIDLLAALFSLPKVHPVLPPPGTTPTDAAPASAIDDRILRRVRGLLAKAESTDSEQEADALSAKAQELMTRYSIERVLTESSDECPPVPGARRLWLDNPYILPKALLVEAVADANRCRCAISERLGVVTVLGFETDLDVVELLVTSLLVQATRAMQLAGSQRGRHGTSHTRSFRQSFLVAYAARVGERLRESADSAVADADERSAGALLPVLVSRERAVDDAFASAFPQVVERGVRVSSAAGWGAGRAAADLAQFDVRDALADRSRPA